jgi:hypothetical protein
MRSVSKRAALAGVIGGLNEGRWRLHAAAVTRKEQNYCGVLAVTRLKNAKRLVACADSAQIGEHFGNSAANDDAPLKPRAGRRHIVTDCQKSR